VNDLERDLRQMFEQREADVRGPRFAPPHSPERVLRRTRRRQVGVVLTVFAVVAGVAIGSTAGAMSLLRSSDRRMPANPSPTPTPTLPVGGLISSPDLGVYDVNVAWGEVDGAPWNIWASQDLSCLAFANGNGTDAGCLYRHDGSDLMAPDTCWYACPVLMRSILFGLVSPRVARVKLEVDGGTVYVATIHPAAPELTVDTRLYTIPTDEGVHTFTGTVTAFGAEGEVLGTVRFPQNADRAGGPSTPVSIEAKLASGAPVSEVDGRTLEDYRWELTIWRNVLGDRCLGTIFPSATPPTAPIVATEGLGCVSRERLFDGIRAGPIGHADVWYGDTYEHGWWTYRAIGTVSADVAAVRLEVGDGQVVDAVLYDLPPGFEDMGRLFLAEFSSKLHPWAEGGEGGIRWRAIALDPNGEVLGSDEITL
jgi:hypothetical protein